MHQRTFDGSGYSTGRVVRDRRHAFGLASRRWLWLFAVPLCLGGCAHSLHLRSRGNGKTEKPAAYPVEVVKSGEINRPYKQIGVVRAPGSMGREEALDELKQRARAIGGVALLDVHLQATDAAGDGGPAASPASAAAWEAGVIVWKDK